MMAKLQTLKPRLATLSPRLQSVTPASHMTDRPRGRSWMETRQRIAIRDRFQCVNCGRPWIASRDTTDHIVPRWKGGADTDDNLQSLCVGCDRVKTAAEAAERAAMGLPPIAPYRRA